MSSLSYTLCSRRTHYSWRFSCVARDNQDLFNQLSAEGNVEQLGSNGKGIPISFVFTGQGAQWSQMGRELLQLNSASAFIKSMSSSSDILCHCGATWNLIDEILREDHESRLHTAELSQPITTAIQIALVDLLDSMGIRPKAVVGHSSGEIAAAYAAGYICQSTALQVSYFRGLVPSISRAKGHANGEMLAVALGVDSVAEYISLVTKGTISIACINSPESTTISGDGIAIDELATILTANDIFNRKLRIDTAYHSYHMRAGAEEYKELMNLIDGGSRPVHPPPARFLSTVSKMEKSNNFDANYWVENLVSTVHFQDGIQNLCRSQGSGHQILVEIGPHSTLAGPTRQTIAAMPEGFKYDYISLLHRGQNSLYSFLTAIGRLFELGSQVDFSVLPSFESMTDNIVVLHDLPAYSWNHLRKHWYESRISRDYRFRKHAYHDLLGVRSPESTPIEPRWRHMISVMSLPWLADHVIDEMNVFPGSGYLCMAIEASSQLVQDRFPNRKIRGVILKDIEFLRALLLPSSSQRKEIQFSLMPVIQKSKKLDGFSHFFRVTGWAHDQVWEEYCRGVIEIDFGDQAQGSITNNYSQELSTLNADQK